MSVQRESQSNRRRLIRLSISAAANGLSRNRLATIAATTTMTLMLMVLASVLVIRAGLDAALSYADSKVEVIAYLKSSVTETEARSIQVQIEGIDGDEGCNVCERRRCPCRLQGALEGAWRAGPHGQSRRESTPRELRDRAR